MASTLMDLHFPDHQGVEDLRTFVSRARAADDDGAVRLQATGTTLAAYVGVLPGGGLLAEGAVLGLRVMPLAEPATVDVTVSLAAVADRLAREVGAVLSLPPMLVSAPWSAVAPPRSGWERVGALPCEVLEEYARQGIEEIARGVPADAGGHAVTALRRQVWGRLTPTTPPVPSGGAFAAYVLGFTEPGTEATVWAHGRWTRLSAPHGHVLVRGAAAP
ncbi:MAG TPA: hypothetical protein VGN19_04415 [Pedococcus sp.]|nr:hypothetical protein [Pedococcus sp.]